MTRTDKPSPNDLARQCRLELMKILELLSELESLEKTSAAPRVADVIEHALNVLYTEYPSAALDHLIQSRRWEHPAQALSRPRPTCRALLEAYQERTKDQRVTKRSRLGQVGKRLRRAAEIAEAARIRRDRNRELDWVLRTEQEDDS